MIAHGGQICPLEVWALISVLPPILIAFQARFGSVFQDSRDHERASEDIRDLDCACYRSRASSSRTRLRRKIGP